MTEDSFHFSLYIHESFFLWLMPFRSSFLTVGSRCSVSFFPFRRGRWWLLLRSLLSTGPSHPHDREEQCVWSLARREAPMRKGSRMVPKSASWKK